MANIDRSLVPISNGRGPGRPWAALAAAAAVCVLAALVACGEAVAQSPFRGAPSRSGQFGIPQPEQAEPSPFRGGPSRRGDIGIPRPGADRPGAMVSPAPPTPSRPGQAPPPAAEAPRRGGALPPLGAPSELPLPLPLADVGGALRSQPLPPGPEVSPPLKAAPTAPVPRAEPIVLRAGLPVTLRVCQVIPIDGMTSGERLLNSHAAIQRGDRFLAEVIAPRPAYPILVGGTVTNISPPRRFGRPGYVSIQMVQLVQAAEGQSGWLPWRMDLTDRRFTTKMRRVLLTTLLGLEGAGTGASIGAQFSSGNMTFIGAGMGIGALIGFGYASFMRGTEANLEPGDTFEITVGSTQIKPVPREWQTILYPATDVKTEARR